MPSPLQVRKYGSARPEDIKLPRIATHARRPAATASALCALARRSLRARAARSAAAASAPCAPARRPLRARTPPARCHCASTACARLPAAAAAPLRAPGRLPPLRAPARPLRPHCARPPAPQQAARSAGASSGAASQISKWRRRHCAVRGRFFLFPNPKQEADTMADQSSSKEAITTEPLQQGFRPSEKGKLSHCPRYQSASTKVDCERVH
ncbi:uncharacterized protein LOC110434085 [Sorghum bicolor]|uniref:uncharacterized protein LOC110434085 n=1 Tax=Sorghum bicolor TaxID=4558 RepID=UPI000B425D1D|nr:uncharacterized protein LOC110434085 [Sorghum bicolor]|eukprot:XP_021313455.1 uncharacterized protein LOC110434085 [Sorghum bicolor]